jgi:hypothetical protein
MGQVMKHIFMAIFLTLAVSARAQDAIIFADYFDIDNMESYVQGCDPGVTGTATWEVAGGLLSSTSSSDGQCYAMVEHETWNIKLVQFRFRNTVGSENGVTISNAIGSVGLSMRTLTGDSLRLRLHTGDQLSADTAHFCCLGGEWVNVILVLANDAWIYLFGEYGLSREIPANVNSLPFNSMRLWSSGSSEAEFDYVFVRGGGTTADEEVSWGHLKSIYR